jgi:hypothetical protein
MIERTLNVVSICGSPRNGSYFTKQQLVSFATFIAARGLRA